MVPDIAKDCSTFTFKGHRLCSFKISGHIYQETQHQVPQDQNNFPLAAFSGTFLNLVALPEMDSAD